ncbi:MAG: cyclase family protein [Pseudomonadota bacterium]|nr:cyclase family protein [Pseudomonadota bacterium]MEE3099765.1 cyclase family protein [Pseudomonadota bacterium]
MPFKTHARIAFAALASLAFAGAAAAADCAPSKWGADDEIGSANLVTSEQVLMASKLVKKGMSAPLGITISRDTPAFAPRSLSMQVVQPGQNGGKDPLGYGGGGVYNDDIIQMWFGIGSQIDGLGHLGDDGRYYNCNKAADISAITGLTKLGVHNVPPLVGRGVVIDMAKHFGKPFLEAGHAITADDVKAAMAEQKIEVKKGDVVLFHTGWTDAKLESAPQEWGTGEPGIMPDVAEMLAAADVMAVGADTWGVDVVPPPAGAKVFYSHVVLLRDNGIYILETMNTGPLVEAGVSEFMFVLGQARVKGSVQMVINPVALW